jgi:hypothetical protein
MPGKKGMKQYRSGIMNDVNLLKSEGKTNREIAEILEFKDVKALKNIITIHNRKKSLLEVGVILRPKGRPRKETNLTIEQEKDNEIKRLKMENELLRSFHQVVGRR